MPIPRRRRRIRSSRRRTCTGWPGCGATWMKEHSMVFVGVRMPDTLPTVFLQQALRLRREVDVPVPCRGFGVLSDDVLACDLHRIPLDVDPVFLVVNIGPLQTAALTPPLMTAVPEMRLNTLSDFSFCRWWISRMAIPWASARRFRADRSR